MVAGDFNFFYTSSEYLKHAFVLEKAVKYA